MTYPLPIGLVLPGAQRWHRANVIMYALELGITPILLVRPDEILSDEIPASTMVVQCSAIPSETELLTIAAELNKYCSRWYVLALDDYISETSALLAQYASAPSYPIASAHVSFHKHLLRQQWNKYCRMHPEMPLQQVEFALYRNDEHTISSSGYHSSNGGYIIKPDAYSGSVGVGFAETKNDVQAGVASCADVLAKETINPEMDGITIDQHVLVEQAIQRQEKLAGCAEFTAHYLSFAGKHHLLGIAEKTIHPSTFIETGHIFPSPSFPKDLVEILEATTTALLDELQVQNTLSNWEYIVTPDNCLVMVEGQLRPSGDHVMELMENAYTVSPYTMLCKAFKDGELDLSFSVQQTSSIY